MHLPKLTRARRRAGTILTIAVSLAIGVPVGVLASHQFTDVPDSNPFHSSIDKIVNAGITSGCGGSSYCPKANVTREQMAAFMTRGFGVLGGAEGTAEIPSTSSGTGTVIASTTFRTPGTSDGTGYLSVDGTAFFLGGQNVGDPLCPCTGVVSLRINGAQQTGFPTATVVSGDVAPYIFSLAHMATVTDQWTYEVPTNTDLTIELVSWVITSNDDSLSAIGHLNVGYAPFSSGGALSLPLEPVGEVTGPFGTNGATPLGG